MCVRMSAYACEIHNGKCWFGNKLLNFSLILTKVYVKRNKSESF